MFCLRVLESIVLITCCKRMGNSLCLLMIKGVLLYKDYKMKINGKYPKPKLTRIRKTTNT